MKKLMTCLASAAVAMFACGAANGEDTVSNYVDFEAEALNVGEDFDSTADDNGGTGGDKFWFAADTSEGAIGAISNYTGEASVSTPIAGRPDQGTAANSKYLALDTSTPLLRTVLANGGSADQINSFAIPEGGIYLDTLVKFTAAEDAFAEDLTGGDKIAISYVEHETGKIKPDGSDEEIDDPDDPGYTNFVIRAGIKVGVELLQTNYFANVPENFDKDAWHRLTVRTIQNVGDGQVGFVVYLIGAKAANGLEKLEEAEVFSDEECVPLIFSNA